MSTPSPLALQALWMFGIASMEPAHFSPAVMSYTVQRIEGKIPSLAFYCSLPPSKATRDATYQAYDEYNIVVHGTCYGEEGTNFYVCSQLEDIADPDNANSLTLPDQECDVTLSFKPVDNSSLGLTYSFKFLPVVTVTTPACPHHYSKSVEMDFWGGGSGSCTVLMATVCEQCKATLNEWYEHRD